MFKRKSYKYILLSVLLSIFFLSPTIHALTAKEKYNSAESSYRKLRKNPRKMKLSELRGRPRRWPRLFRKTARRAIEMWRALYAKPKLQTGREMSRRRWAYSLQSQVQPLATKMYLFIACSFSHHQ